MVGKKNAVWSRTLDCATSPQGTGFTSEKKIQSTAIAVRNVTTLPSKTLTAAHIASSDFFAICEHGDAGSELR